MVIFHRSVKFPAKWKERECAMRNHDHLANGAGARKLENRDRQDTEAALEVLRLQLDSVTATVARLERQSQLRQTSPFRPIRIAGIITAVVAVAGLLWFALLARLS
jgi:hypothetical protein